MSDSIRTLGHAQVVIDRHCLKVYTAEGDARSTYMHDIFFDKSVDPHTQYDDLLYFLESVVREQDTVKFNLANFGGCLHRTAELVNAIQACPAAVNMIVNAPCYSAGALLALAGDSLIMKSNTFLMFHNYSSVVGGKGGELIDQVEHSHKWIRSLMKNIMAPFLTASEVKKIANDQDVYIYADHADLVKRLRRHFPMMRDMLKDVK